MKGLDFVAIDFETATSARSSICEVGIAVVVDSQIKMTRSWLVKPARNEYARFNVGLHGITPEMTADAPDFKTAWEAIRPCLEGQAIVAHNSSFDMYALRDALDINDLKYPTISHYCSRRLAQKSELLKDCFDYKLTTLCNTLGVDLSVHHRAESDAIGCAHIFIECVKAAAVNSLEELQKKYRFECGRFIAPNHFIPQRAICQSTRPSTKRDPVVGNSDLTDEGSYFFGKEVCFTGTFSYGTRQNLQQKIADIGGIPVNNITTHTDILVVGQQDYRIVGDDAMSSKQRKAQVLKTQGYEIEIMSEEDFMENI